MGHAARSLDGGYQSPFRIRPRLGVENDSLHSSQTARPRALPPPRPAFVPMLGGARRRAWFTTATIAASTPIVPSIATPVSLTSLHLRGANACVCGWRLRERAGEETAEAPESEVEASDARELGDVREFVQTSAV